MEIALNVNNPEQREFLLKNHTFRGFVLISNVVPLFQALRDMEEKEGRKLNDRELTVFVTEGFPTIIKGMEKDEVEMKNEIEGLTMMHEALKKMGR